MWRPLSPSSVDMFLTCPRKWAFRYLAGILEPENDRGEAAKRGDRLHKTAEIYLATGEVMGEPAIIELFQRGVHMLPAPGTAVPEQQLGGVLEGEIYYHCRVDVVRPGVGIDDHKITSGKGLATLVDNAQAIMCANAYFEHYPDHDGPCQAKWNYWSTRSKKTWELLHAFGRDEVAARMADKILPAARAMHALRKNLLDYINGMPNDTDRCGDYGKQCPAIQECDYGTPPLVTLDQLLQRKNKK